MKQQYLLEFNDIIDPIEISKDGKLKLLYSKHGIPQHMLDNVTVKNSKIDFNNSVVTGKSNIIDSTIGNHFTIQDSSIIDSTVAYTKNYPDNTILQVKNSKLTKSHISGKSVQIYHSDIENCVINAGVGIFESTIKNVHIDIPKEDIKIKNITYIGEHISIDNIEDFNNFMFSNIKCTKETKDFYIYVGINEGTCISIYNKYNLQCDYKTDGMSLLVVKDDSELRKELNGIRIIDNLQHYSLSRFISPAILLAISVLQEAIGITNVVYWESFDFHIQHNYKLFCAAYNKYESFREYFRAWDIVNNTYMIQSIEDGIMLLESDSIEDINSTLNNEQLCDAIHKITSIDEDMFSDVSELSYYTTNEADLHILTLYNKYKNKKDATILSTHNDFSKTAIQFFLGFYEDSGNYSEDDYEDYADIYNIGEKFHDIYVDSYREDIDEILFNAAIKFMSVKDKFGFYYVLDNDNRNYKLYNDGNALLSGSYKSAFEDSQFSKDVSVRSLKFAKKVSSLIMRIE